MHAPCAQALVPWAVALWQWRHVPGPCPLPVLGNAPWVLRLGLYEYVRQQCQKFKAQRVFKARAARSARTAANACALTHASMHAHPSSPQMFMGPQMLIVTVNPEDTRLVNRKSNTCFLQPTLNVRRSPRDVFVLDGLVGAK